jgi:peptidoglycan/LPS O-acetylase OafA/YrhL
LIANKHLLGLDILRFVAAMLVVVWHFTYWGWIGAVAEQPPRTGVPFPELRDWTFFGGIGVEIFFMISGFVIAASASGATAWTFLRSRAARLLPVLWFCATLALLVRLAAGEGLVDLLPVYLASILALPKGPYIDGVIWTLAVEVVFYGVVFLFLLDRSFGQARRLLLLLTAWSGLFWVAMLYLEITGIDARELTDPVRWITTITLMRHGCFFAVGVSLWILFNQRHSAKLYLALVANVAFCAIAIHFMYGLRYDSLVPLGAWLGALAFLAASVAANDALWRRLRAWSEAIRTIGLMTYPVYLIHYVPGLVLMGWLADLGLDRFAILVTATAGVLGASYLLVKAFEPAGRSAVIAAFNTAERLARRTGRIPWPS